MPEVLIQRLDRAGYLESYPLYVNRKLTARIAFGETYHLELEPGRYQLHCGGLFALEDEIWLDITEHRKALFLSAERPKSLKAPWPKYYRLKWTETTPIQIKKEEEQAVLKSEQGNALIRAFGFLALLALGSAWMFWQSMEYEEPLLSFGGIALLVAIPWAYRGALLSQLKER
tara:strand:+ start:1293 stop:1811 length:519 start_codon:yes stop_codon:yes gene_type:complete